MLGLLGSSLAAQPLVVWATGGQLANKDSRAASTPQRRMRFAG